MSSVVISGDTSGAITLQAPAIAGSTTLTLPASSGTVVTSANINDYAQSFPSGTRLAFQQTAAPTGWTKDTTAALNDSIMRIVTGTASSGGSTAFSTFNGQTATGATTLAESQIPSHTHPNGASNNTSSVSGGGVSNSRASYASTTGSTGGGGSHTHSMTTAIKYYDFIIASKD